MSKTFKIPKDVVSAIVEGSKEEEFFGGITYDIFKVVVALERRGLVGGGWLEGGLLQVILNPYRDFAKRENFSEATVDKALEFLSSRLQIDLNYVRRQYYLDEFERWTQKVREMPLDKDEEFKEKPSPAPEGKEEIELNVEEEGKEKDEWEEEEF